MRESIFILVAVECYQSNVRLGAKLRHFFRSPLEVNASSNKRIDFFINLNKISMFNKGAQREFRKTSHFVDEHGVIVKTAFCWRVPHIFDQDCTLSLPKFLKFAKTSRKISSS